MGFVVYTFFLGEGGWDVRDYAVEYASFVYGMPMDVASKDSVVSMSKQFFYVCDGELRSFFEDQAAGLKETLADLRSVMPAAR